MALTRREPSPAQLAARPCRPITPQAHRHPAAAQAMALAPLAEPAVQGPARAVAQALPAAEPEEPEVALAAGRIKAAHDEHRGLLLCADFTSA